MDETKQTPFSKADIVFSIGPSNLLNLDHPLKLAGPLPPQAYARNVILDGADLTNGILDRIDLTDASLKNVKLVNAVITGRCLRGIGAYRSS